MTIDVQLAALTLSGPWEDRTATHPVVAGLHLPRRGIAFREARRLADIRDGVSDWSTGSRREYHLLRERVETPLTIYAEIYTDVTRAVFDYWMAEVFNLGLWAAGESASGAVSNPLAGRVAERALDAVSDELFDWVEPEVVADGEWIVEEDFETPQTVEIPLRLRDTLREPDDKPARPRGKRPGRRQGKLLARAGSPIGTITLHLTPLR